MKKLLVLGIVVMFATVAQAQVYLDDDFGTDTGKIIYDPSVWVNAWSADPTVTMFGDYANMNTGYGGLPLGTLGLPGADADLNIEWRMQNPGNTNSHIYLGDGDTWQAILSINWLYDSGPTPNAIQFYLDRTDNNVAPAGFDGSAWNTYLVQLRAGAGELFVNGVSCGIITPGGAGAIADGMDIQFGYNNTNLDYVRIFSGDWDSSKIQVTPASVEVTENGSAVNFTVVLKEEPNSLVTVLVDPNDNYNAMDYFLDSEAPGDSITLSFTPSNWNTPQTVSVTAVDDAENEALTEDGLINLISSCSDPNFVGSSQVMVTIVDDDRGWDLQYDLGSDGDGSLTDIGCGNLEWGGPITETVYADYVAVDGNNSGYPGGHFGKQDLGLAGLDRNGPWSFEMVVDTPEGIYFSPSMGSNWPIFNGIRDSGGDYYQVSNHVGSYNNMGMDLAPTGHDGTQLHTYMVCQPGGGAPADVFIDGVFITKVSWAAGARNDNYDFYCRLFDGILNVYELKFADSYVDNILSYVQVDPTSVGVTEGDSAETFTVVLGEEPGSSVTVLVQPDQKVADYFLDSEVPGDPVTLSFTTSNWDTPQTVSVTAFDDSTTEDPTEQGIIKLTSSCSDPNFAGTILVTVGITDDDQPGVDVVESGDSTDVIEGGASDSFTMQLNSQPTEMVTVLVGSAVMVPKSPTDPNLVPGPLEEVTVNSGSTTTLTFTTSNWNTAQTVTVQAVDDEVAETDPHSEDLAFAVTQAGGNQEYDGLSVPNITVSIGDNDCGMGPFDPFDVTGPDGVPDCIVNFYDFAVFASKWLDCSLTGGCP